MTRPRYCPLLFIIFSIMVYMDAEVNAGPLSLSFARSFRSGREIRTPFKSPGIMVARGFGKRNPLPVIDDANNGNAAAAATSADKFTPSSAALFQAGNNAGYGGDTANYDNEKAPIDWLTTEMAANPNLARLLLHRLVDFSDDGKLSPRKLISSPFESVEYF